MSTVLIAKTTDGNHFEEDSKEIKKILKKIYYRHFQKILLKSQN